jgi:peptide deformylase
MAVRDIPQIGNPVLRTPTRRVDVEELATSGMQAIIDDMIETMRHANGAGIAANQIGESVRICVIGVEDNPRYPYKPPIPLTILVNPDVTVVGTETYANNEGCLSVPLRGNLDRWAHIEVTAIDRNGLPFTREYRGLTAGTVQHEVDHLEGGLFIDRVADTRTLSTWGDFDQFQKEAFVRHITAVVDRLGS